MKIALAFRLTKLEWDMRRLDKSQVEIIDFYKKSDRNVDNILNAHKRQISARREAKKLFPNSEVLDIPSIEAGKERRDDIDVVIALGGDNFFQLIAHLFSKAYLVGVNSDPKSSSGIILNYDIPRLKKESDNIIKGKFNHEKWTKIKVVLNGKDMGDVNCIAALSIKATDMVSRYRIEANGRSEEQIATGFLVVSGAGSGRRSWYRSAGLYLPALECGIYETTSEFSREAKEIHTLTREPIGAEECSFNMLNLKLKGKEKLTLTYWSSHESELSLDSIYRFDVKEGDVLEFSVSDKVLKVVK